CESWLTRKGDPLFPDKPEGSWAVGIKIEDENLWEECKAGKLTGLSLAGVSKVEYLEKEEDEVDETFVRKVLRALGVLRQKMEKEETGIEKEAVSLDSLPLEREKAWDWDWARDGDRIIKRYGWKGLASICLYVDKDYPAREKEDGLPKAKAAYKFPVAKIDSDGRLKVFWRGVVAARVRTQTSKLPNDVKESVLNRI
ncbi:MAG: XkdF-like putative serine protease domain-containing protein, partial [Candidatus Methanospirareceae archaeon]